MAAVILFSIIGTYALQGPIAETRVPDQAWVAWIVVLIASLFGFWGNAYSAALQGMNTIAPLRRWESAMGLAQVGSACATLLLGGGLLALVLVHQAWAIASAYRNRYLLSQLHPELLTGPAQADKEVLKVMWPATWRSGVGVLMSQGIIQASGLLYTRLATAEELAAYLIALRVITIISQFSQAPFYSKLPYMTGLFASGKKQEVMAVAQRGMRISQWVLVAALLLVMIFAAPALALIGSKTQFVSFSMWTVMSLAFFVERFGAMHLQIYSLSNHILWHIANGVTGVIMVSVAAFGYTKIGLYAFPVGMLTGYAGFYAILAVKKSMPVLNTNIIAFERKASMFPLMLMLAGISIYAAYHG
jgi:hypothetical protein